MEGSPTEDTKLSLGGTTDSKFGADLDSGISVLGIKFTFVKNYLHGNLRLDRVSRCLQVKQSMWHILR
jgi:hypothetical protein